jgi:hypothetical protein
VEELGALNQRVIFYLKFHCELNFIERFWCSAKFYAQENCGYSLEVLRKTVLEAFHFISRPRSIGTTKNACRF